MKHFISIILTLFIFTNVHAEWDPTKLQSWEKEAISDIFTSMAEKSVPALIFDTFRLTRLGDSIEHVPPLQFIGYLMTDAYLKDCIRSISHSYFKWPPFLEGIQNNMEKEINKGTLFSDLPFFAKLVGGDLEKLTYYSKHRKWDEFVKSLL